MLALSVLALGTAVYLSSRVTLGLTATSYTYTGGDLLVLVRTLQGIFTAASAVSAAAKVVDNRGLDRPAKWLGWVVNGAGVVSGLALAAAALIILVQLAVGQGSLYVEAPATPTIGIPIAWCVFIGTGSGLWFVIGNFLLGFGRHRRRLALAPPNVDSLAVRVALAQASLARTGESLRDALASTTEIVDALEHELRARRSALDALTAQAQAAEARADQARELARIEQSAASALDALLDRRLGERLEEMENAGRRWDAKVTALSLVASLPLGVAAGYLVPVLFGR